jgi:hypothetical protein
MKKKMGSSKVRALRMLFITMIVLLASLELGEAFKSFGDEAWKLPTMRKCLHTGYTST